MTADSFAPPAEAFGKYLKAQRELARLSLRQLAEMTNISNPYLSQIERGVHRPSVRVIRSLADALDLSAQVLLAQAAGIERAKNGDPGQGTESAIKADPRLTSEQKVALLTIIRGFVGSDNATAAAESA